MEIRLAVAEENEGCSATPRGQMDSTGPSPTRCSMGPWIKPDPNPTSLSPPRCPAMDTLGLAAGASKERCKPAERGDGLFLMWYCPYSGSRFLAFWKNPVTLEIPIIS